MALGNLSNWIEGVPSANLDSNQEVKFWIGGLPGEAIDSVAATPTTATLNDTLSLSDTISRVLGFCIQLSDTLSFADTLDSSQILGLVLTDTLSLSDILDVIRLDYALSFSDQLSFTDFLGDAFSNIGVPLADLLLFSDRYASNMIVLADDINHWNDAVAEYLNAVLSFADTLSFSDRLTYLAPIPLLFTEQISPSDHLVLSYAVAHLSVADFIQFLDQLYTKRTDSPAFGDSLAFTDSSRAVLGVSLNFNDHLTFSDSLTTNRTSQLTVSLVDQLVFSDGVIQRVPTSTTNYIRKYLNDLPPGEISTRPALDTSGNPSNATLRAYLRRYLNDVSN